MEKSKQSDSANYDGFSLVSGGLIYSLMSFIGKSDKPSETRKKRALAITLITWLPLLLLTLMAGAQHADGEGVTFLKDFEIHIRFLFAVPFLVLIERMVDKSFIEYIKTSDNLVIQEEQPAYNKLVSNLDKLSNLYLPEIIILLAIYSLIFIRWNDPSLFDNTKNYLMNPNDGTYTIAGIYYLFVSFPVFQLLFFRWVWRWLIWVYSIFKISRFTFQIEAPNIDQMAGLTYTNLVPLLFSFIFFSLSAVLASNIGYEIIYDGTSLKSYYMDILFYTIFVAAVLYSPLLFFIPLLIRTKTSAIHRLGNLVATHNHDFMQKWIYNNSPPNEEILGSVDASSLADMNGGYQPAINMKLVPISFNMFLLSCIVIIVPFIPLIFTYYSIKDLFSLVMKTTFG